VRPSFLILALALGCSGGLAGDPVTEPVSDWSFVADAEDLAFETTSGETFTWAAAGGLVHEGELFLHVSTIFTVEDDALTSILAGDGVRMHADGKLYDLRATRLTDAAAIERILPTLVREQMKVEATGVRWEPESERYPGTQVRQWFFRLESAAG
jgi:hypothetical protein